MRGELPAFEPRRIEPALGRKLGQELALGGAEQALRRFERAPGQRQKIGQEWRDILDR